MCIFSLILVILFVIALVYFPMKMIKDTLDKDNKQYMSNNTILYSYIGMSALVGLIGYIKKYNFFDVFILSIITTPILASYIVFKKQK